MSRPRVVALAATGVTFVQSPRYLAETIADAVDARMADARDERRFWRNVQRAWELRPSELPELQARIARKYCRNLDIWSALPELRREYRLVLVYTGPVTVLDCWRSEYPLARTFETVIEAAPRGLTARDAALYRLVAEMAGVAPAACAVVDSTARGVDAAIAAELPAYRYGTAYGLRRWLRERAGEVT